MYPKATKSLNRATTYGPLPTHGFTEIALVLHSTETSGMPSFRDGETAPHYTYDPRSREWLEWADPDDGYVGTMRGHTTGGHSNCKALQVEIIGYSDRTLADGRTGLWMGELSDDNYRDLADFYRWVIGEFGVGKAYFTFTSDSWLSGVNSPMRMSDQGWAEFSGITAHGGVPNNSHWDTGVLDLSRIYDLAAESEGFDPPDSWAREDWTWAENAHIMTEDSDPHKTVTKQEMAAFLRRTVRHIDKGGHA